MSNNKKENKLLKSIILYAIFLSLLMIISVAVGGYIALYTFSTL